MAQAQAGAPNKFSIDHILQKTTANDDAQRGNPIDDEHHDDNLNYLITMATTAPVATTPLTSEDAIATPGNSGDGAVRTDGAAVTTPQPSTSKVRRPSACVLPVHHGRSVNRASHTPDTWMGSWQQKSNASCKRIPLMWKGSQCIFL